MNAMLHAFRGISRKQNTAGLLAVTWGAGLGCALSLSLTVFIAYSLFGTQTAVTICASVIAVLTVIGSCVWILMEWVFPSVQDARSFFTALRNAAIAAFFMPVFLVWLVFARSAAKIFTPMVNFVGLFRKQAKSGEDRHETLPSHHSV